MRMISRFLSRHPLYANMHDIYHCVSWEEEHGLSKMWHLEPG